MKTPHQNKVESGIGPVFNPWIGRVALAILIVLSGWVWTLI